MFQYSKNCLNKNFYQTEKIYYVHIVYKLCLKLTDKSISQNLNILDKL